MYDFVCKLENINNAINEVVWGPVTLIAIIAIGLFFSVGTRFFQLRHFKLWFTETLGTLFKKKKTKNEKNSKNLTQWQAFSTALAGTLGTGNIVGVATAISLGGPGAIFWMWLSAIFGMMTSYAERVLGILYREKSEDGEYRGGPMYYIEKGLKCKWLACLFSIFCVGASFGMGNAAQVNAISVSLGQTFGIPKLWTGIIVAALAAVIIIGGVKRIGSFSGIFIPFISVVYIIGCLVLIFINFKNIPSVLYDIFLQAFSFKSAAGGTGGFIIANAIKYGVSRGVFSNEAGLGASVIVHSTSEVDTPSRQGMWGICEVFIDTIVVCTITALAILTSNVDIYSTNCDILTLAAFEEGFGFFGKAFLSVSISAFAIASLVGWSVYGLKAYQYLSADSGFWFKILFILMIIPGSIAELDLVWDISDTLNGLMAVPNLIAVVFLYKKVLNSYRKDLNIFSKSKKLR